MTKRFMTYKDIIESSPCGRDHFWKVIKKDPRFPKPLEGMGKQKEIYSGSEIEAYFDLISVSGIPNAKSV